MSDVNPVSAKSSGSPAESPLGWLRTEIDRLFDDFGRPARNLFNFGANALAPIPALEMSEHDKEYRLTVELPGIRQEDVDVSIADGQLTISGEKREESERKEEDCLISERRYGRFSRRVNLPDDVDVAAIKADFAEGVLTVTLPKDETAAERTRRIPISSNA